MNQHSLPCAQLFLFPSNQEVNTDRAWFTTLYNSVSSLQKKGKLPAIPHNALATKEEFHK